MDFDSFLDRLFKREGSFSNDAKDKGGPTSFGITMAVLASWRSSPVTPDDVKHLTRSEAASIYERIYFVNHKIGLLPVEIAEQVFDFGVLSGPLRAIQALQECLGITADGVIGSMTIAAALVACDRDPRGLNISLAKWRIMMFSRIVQRDPSQIKFLGGWLVRSTSFLH